MTVEWWGSCPGCMSSIGLAADWRIRLWADGVLVLERRITAAPSTPGVAEKLETTVNVPTTTANQRFVLHVDSVYVDIMNGTAIYYDSAAPCPTSTSTAPCDSLARVPVGAADTAAAPADPANVRVTDLHDGLGIAWAAASGAASYEVYRSDSPVAVGRRVAKVTGTSHVDKSAQLDRTYYYRVVSLDSAGRRGLASEAAYGMRTRYDRQVRVKVDRVYGPQYCEYVNLGKDDATSWSYPWHTLGLSGGEHAVSARSFTQGQGSSSAAIKLTLAR